MLMFMPKCNFLGALELLQQIAVVIGFIIGHLPFCNKGQTQKCESVQGPHGMLNEHHAEI